MFSDWLQDYSSEKTRKTWKRILHDGEPYVWDDDFKTTLLKQEGGPFLLHVLMCVMHINPTRNRQQQYIGFILKFKGLSRKGLEFASWLGLTPGLRTLDKFIKDKKEEAARECRYMLCRWRRVWIICPCESKMSLDV